MDMRRTLSMALFVGFLSAGSALAVPAADRSGWLLPEHVDSSLWEMRYEAAQERARAEGKDLLVLFTGSDWCPYCIAMEKAVFSRPAFKQGVGDRYVPLYLDFPEGYQQPESLVAQNRGLQERFGVEGYPTVVLADAEGSVYARRGFEEGEDAAAFLAAVGKVTARNETVRAMRRAVDGATGLEKARALDRLLEENLRAGESERAGELVDEILALDPSDETGLRSKYVGFVEERGTEDRVEKRRLADRLVKAAYDEDIEGVRAALDEGADVNGEDYDGNVPLYWAAFIEDPAMVDLLLKAGADPAIRNRNGATPLHAAALGGYSAPAIRLLEAGADIDAPDNDGDSPLILACIRGNEEVALLLLSRGASPLLKDRSGFTALAYAGAVPSLAEAIVNAGGRPSSLDKMADLIRAVKRGDRKAIDAALAGGARANTRLPGDGGATPLLVAVDGGDVQIVSHLLAKGADPLMADAAGNTPLHRAATAKRADMIRALLQGGGAVDAINDEGLSPLLSAVLTVEQSPVAAYLCAAELIKAGADVNLPGRNGLLSLVMASHQGDLPLIRLLMRAGADPFMKDGMAIRPSPSPKEMCATPSTRT